MSAKLIQTKAPLADAKASTELNLGIKLIDEVMVRMPHAAFGQATNPVHATRSILARV